MVRDILVVPARMRRNELFTSPSRQCIGANSPLKVAYMPSPCELSVLANFRSPAAIQQLVLFTRDICRPPAI
jgi:hypothetical protein